MRAEGTVIAIDGDNATVAVMQQSACAGCSGACAGCHKSVQHTVSVKNSIGATLGERVYVESKSTVIYAICALLFILPLVVAGVVYVLFWGGFDSGIGALVAFLSALAAFVVLYLTIGKKLLRCNEYKLVKIIR